MRFFLLNIEGAGRISECGTRCGHLHVRVLALVTLWSPRDMAGIDQWKIRGLASPPKMMGSCDVASLAPKLGFISQGPSWYPGGAENLPLMGLVCVEYHL
jgi:hypothetical protein